MSDPIKLAMSAYFGAIGRKGGKKGGKARWKDTTPEERSAAMKELAAAKKAKKQKPEGG